MKSDVFDRITQQIITAIEAGASEYIMPWHRLGDDLTAPVNVSSGKTYRGLNILTLWLSGQAAGYSTGQWATYRQWNEIGAQVRKGERASPIFFWQTREAQTASAADDAPSANNARPGFVARTFTVFNAEQVEGYNPERGLELADHERIAAAERFFAGTGADIRHGGDRAYYSPSPDYIQVPALPQFRSPEAYYAVLAHELTHWTGAKHRLDRCLGNRFGSEAYAMEELIAELGAAFTCARLAIATEPRRDHAPYIASWLKALRSDPRAILAAASKAQEAADYLQRLEAASDN